MDKLVGWFHSIHVWLGIAGDHVVVELAGGSQLLTSGRERRSRNIPVESGWTSGRDAPREGGLEQGCWGGVGGCGGRLGQSQQARRRLCHSVEAESVLWDLVIPPVAESESDVTHGEPRLPDLSSTVTLPHGPSASAGAAKLMDEDRSCIYLRRRRETQKTPTPKGRILMNDFQREKFT